MEGLDLKSLIKYGDILAAVRAKHGGYVNIIDYDVETGTKSVQGYTSLMLRVTVQISDNDEIKTSKLIVKRPPQLATQLLVTGEVGIFNREIIYFNKVLPILNKINNELPIVKIYVAHNEAIVMEDLDDKGYENIGKTGQDAIKLDLITINHIRLAVRKLAELHVATLNYNWHDIIGKINFENDPFLIEGGAYEKWIDSMGKVMIKIINELYPEKKDKYNSFFEYKNLKHLLKKYLSYDSKSLNVLIHGDFWINNLMFKTNPGNTEEPKSVKFVDFQLFRYAPPSRDILYFMYFCLSKHFRDKYEKEILETYVKAFNTYANRTPDLLTYESFSNEYNSSRIFGLIMGLLLRPTFFLEHILPEEGEKLSEETYVEVMQGDQVTMHFNQYKNNPTYKAMFTDILNEFLEEIDKHNMV